MLPAGFYGPVRAKPIALADGTILAGTSVETHRNWTPYVDRSTDGGVTWTRSNAFPVPGNFGQIQPTLAVGSKGQIVVLMRSRGPKLICRSVSTDGGKTYSAAEPLKDMPNPSAGIDAVTLGGAIYLIHNPTIIGRSPITVSKSTDDGLTFTKVLDLETEPGEYSYPAMVDGGDGTLAITYTWRRTHIKFVVIETNGKIVIA
jgi:predicted neuraminidase